MAPPNNPRRVARRALGMPGNIEPERLTRPANVAFIWGTVLLAWLLSLLPWRQWPASPDILLLVIAFWSAYEPRRVGMFTAFIFGLLMDVHDAGLLGTHALSYTLTAYGALALSRRMQRFDLWSQAMHMLPVFVGAQLLVQIILAWLAGRWAGWDWALAALLTTALWPVCGAVLQLPQRRRDDGESSVV